MELYSSSITGPPFGLAGEPVFPGQQFNLHFAFNNDADQAAILAYDWYLNGLQVSGHNAAELSGELACGTYTAGGRILTAQGWSGVKTFTFQTCAEPDTISLTGPDTVSEGAEVSYRVVASYFNGVTQDISDQYTFSCADGTFAGHLFTAFPNSSSGDTRSSSIQATGPEGSIISKPVTIVDASPAVYPVSVLVLDLLDCPDLEVVATAVLPGISPAPSVYTGHNRYPDTDPAQALMLAADLVSPNGLSWRFEFNIQQLVSQFPQQQEFEFYLRGKSTTAGMVSGAFALKGTGAVMAMTGNPGTYVPTVTGGSNFSTGSLSFQSLAGATGSYLNGEVPFLLKLVYHVAQQTLQTSTTPLWFNTPQSQTFTRNDCGSGYTGSAVTYSVPAGTYSSAISQADADEQASTEVQQQGQDYANMQGACMPNVIPFNSFDYMVVKYQWAEGAGHDLDILVGYEGNGTTADGLYVGYGQPGPTVPAEAGTLPEAYLRWGTDSAADAGEEAVLIGIKKFVQDNPDVEEEIEIGLYAVWYGAVGTGVFTVELTTYTGGNMDIIGSNFINIGGSQVDVYTFDLTTTMTSRAHSPATSYKLGILKYNKFSQQSIIELI